MVSIWSCKRQAAMLQCRNKWSI